MFKLERSIHAEFCTAMHHCHISLTVCNLRNASEHGIQGVSMAVLLLSTATTLSYSARHDFFLKTLCWCSFCFFQPLCCDKYLHNNHPLSTLIYSEIAPSAFISYEMYS